MSAQTEGSSRITPLVSADWLAARLGDPALLVLDIRSSVDGGGKEAYEAAHIPGAIHTDYVRDGWRVTRGMASGLLPERDQLIALLARIGLTPEKQVVIAPAGTSLGDFSAAARVYWTLKIAGHRQVAILDGGTATWRRASSRPVESGPSPQAKQIPPYPLNIQARLRSRVEDITKGVATSSPLLIDTRSRSFFEGRDQSPQALRAGRLPGAIHRDHAEAFDTSAGKLRPHDELVKLFADLPDGPTSSYCNTGHQAATTWFVLSELLGRSDSALYDGSMSEWTEDARRPVKTGP